MTMQYQVVAQFRLDLPIPPSESYIGELVMSKHGDMDGAQELRARLLEHEPDLIDRVKRAQEVYYRCHVFVDYQTRAVI